MKKTLIGFIAIGLLTFVGCEKEDDDTETATTVSKETASDDGTTSTVTSSDKGTDSSTDDDTTDTTSISYSVEYGEGATDIVGNTYKSVIIGDQEWMAENLRTFKFSDGTSIPNLTDFSEWGNNTTGAWCHYDNDSDYESTYGKLYNWYAVETDKLCPTGWHVPTDAEWTVLIDYLTANGHSGEEGKALKATSGWDDYGSASGNGTDDYGWLGLPGGWRDFNGLSNFSNIGDYGLWWSSSNNKPYNAWFRRLSGSGSVYRNYESSRDGHSVRCLRD